MLPQASQSDAGANRLSRIEPLISARLAEIEPLLAEAGMVARYVPLQLVCDLVPPAAPVRVPAHTIPVEIDDRPAGTVEILAPRPPADFSVAFLQRLVQSWCQEWAAAIREEALLEELSSSWESLEALYEVSSSFRLSHTPEVLLEGLLERAANMAPGLAAALWLLQPDGTVRAAAIRNCPPLPPAEPSGPVARCISTRDSVLVNRRTALLDFPGLPRHLCSALQVAAAPIITSEGLKGVLELWVSRPAAEFTTHLLRFIEALAHQVGLVIDNDRLNRAFVESARIRRDIEIGSSIQQTLLSGRAPSDLPGITVAAASHPSQTVDGDFYDFVRWRDACLDVIVGDVMGKGIPAALLGAAVKSAFLRTMANLSSENQAGGINSILCSVHEDIVPNLLRLESFVSLCYARFDLNARTVEFVDCGHPRSIHYRRREADCVFLEGGSLPLGFSPSASYEPSIEPFAPGDLFLFYSDGIPEARDAAGEFFGSARLARLLAENSARPAGEILHAIEKAVFDFAGTENLGDDFTCVIVEVAPELPIELVRSEWAASFANASAAREWVAAQVRRAFPRVEDDLLYWSVEIAAAETFANIVEHAYTCDPSGLIRVELQFYAERLAIRFTHWGKGFDPIRVPPPDFDGSRERGFGLFIVSSVMDSLQYRHEGAFGHLITMEKRFPSVQE